ncbi:MAG: DUF4139 domain-containing protein [Armatimonadetes bacterium]|nr:DUF4139 domain-containing protein [Armatimonadota bacterium]
MQTLRSSPLRDRRSIVWAGLALSSCALVVTTGCGRTARAEPVSKSERTGIELSVYKQDFAMVQESRAVRLAQGKTKVSVRDVSPVLDPESVLFGWKGAVKADVVGNTYDLGSAESGHLLKRYLGQEVELVWYGENGREGQRLKGMLQSAGEGGTVFESGGKLYVNPPATVVVPDTGDVVLRPSLKADVQSTTAGDAEMTVSYLTRGLSWSADYVATLDEDGEKAALECWATVTNTTGTVFPSAAVTLVAGSPNRAVRERRFESPQRSATLSESEDKDMSGFSARKTQVSAPEVVGELYEYKVQSTSTIASDQMNRLKMFFSDSVPIAKDYSVRLPDTYMYGSDRPQRQNAQLAVSFSNSVKSGLGMPLPQGAVRVYDSGRYVGAASIPDSPRDDRISLTLSSVFDVRAETKRVKTTRLDKRHLRYDVESTLTNQKKGSVVVRVVQSWYGAKLVSESEKSVRLDASTAQWKVSVEPGTTKTLKFSLTVEG